MFADPQRNIEFLGLQPGMSVVDLGAGTGFYSIAASKQVGSSGKVYAVEVQKDLLQKIKTNASHEHLFNIEVIWGNMEKIGGTHLRDASIDRAIVSNVLFQVENKSDFCLEIKRILKFGGKVMIVEWVPGTPLGPKTSVSQIVVQAMFEKIGFSLDTTFSAGDHHYGLIFKRQ